MKDLEDRLAIQDPKLFKKKYEELRERAYPVDPEADGDFDRDDIRAVRKIIGGDRLKDNAGKRVIKRLNDGHT